MSAFRGAVQETAAGRRACRDDVNPQRARFSRRLPLHLYAVDGRTLPASLPGAFLTHPCGDPFLALPAAPSLHALAESRSRSAADQALALVPPSTRFWQDAPALAATAARL